MAHSLSSECTPLKLEYDSCFKAWFEGYLEPAVAASSVSHSAREDYSQRKAAEFNEKCGRVWRNYRDCVQKAVTEKGLDVLLRDSRDENPLKEPPPPSSEASP